MMKLPHGANDQGPARAFPEWTPFHPPKLTSDNFTSFPFQFSTNFFFSHQAVRTRNTQHVCHTENRSALTVRYILIFILTKAHAN
jgi:hypothetical protein